VDQKDEDRFFYSNYERHVSQTLCNRLFGLIIELKSILVMLRPT